MGQGDQLDGDSVDSGLAADLLEALYVPRLIRHIQVLYRGMIEAETQIYIKIGTSGTGGMGLNVPYTHSEEKPSRVLLSKSAVAGAHSLLLFLMARTPGAPITKEIKPAAAIAWKKIAHGPIVRGGQELHLVEAEPRRLFDRAAIRAILRWKFKPRIVDGRAVSRDAEQTIDFKLDQS